MLRDTHLKEHTMSDNLRQYRAIRNALTQGYPREPTGRVARHVATLAALISGIVASKSTQLPQVAAQVPDGTKPESRVKRFARWVGNTTITEEVYFVPYAQVLLCSPVKVIHLLSFCYTTGLLHRHSEGGHHAGQNIRTFCGEKSSFRHGTWHVGTRPGSGPTRCLVCPDGAEAVHPYLVVFNRLCLAQPGRLSPQALGACSLSGPRRRGWGLPHRGLQQTQRGRDPHLGSTGALECGGIDATSRAA